MTADALFLLRRPEPPTGFRDLDAVVLTRAVLSDAGTTLSEGEAGTVVAVLEETSGYIVEFSEPAGTLATVGDSDLRAA